MHNNYIYLASIFKSYYITDSTLTRAIIGIGKQPKQFLAIAKKNVLELMDLTNNSLESVLEIEFFGIITNVINIPISNEAKSDFLFIYTASDNYVIGSIIEGLFIKKYEGNLKNFSQTKFRDEDDLEMAYVFSNIH